VLSALAGGEILKYAGGLLVDPGFETEADVAAAAQREIFTLPVSTRMTAIPGKLPGSEKPDTR
jgi:hypothetical protein